MGRSYHAPQLDMVGAVAKKSSASSQPAKLTRVSAESIWSKPLSKQQKETLKAVASRQKAATALEINYSEIPRLTDRQLTEFRRPPKKLVAVRLDTDVFEWLQGLGSGYSTRINNVLRVVMPQGQ